jgi:hypothetical protein
MYVEGRLAGCLARLGREWVAVTDGSGSGWGSGCGNVAVAGAAAAGPDGHFEWSHVGDRSMRGLMRRSLDVWMSLDERLTVVVCVFETDGMETRYTATHPLSHTHTLPHTATHLQSATTNTHGIHLLSPHANARLNVCHPPCFYMFIHTLPHCPTTATATQPLPLPPCHCHCQFSATGRTVAELGSGTSLPGLVCAIGPHAASHVALTDLAPLMGLVAGAALAAACVAVGGWDRDQSTQRNSAVRMVPGASRGGAGGARGGGLGLLLL